MGAPAPAEWRRESFLVSTRAERFDLAAIHRFLSGSYWAKGIKEETVRRSIEHSLCFGVFLEERQIGFARVVTDRSTFAYLADVYIDESYRGRGLSKWLMECIVSHSDLQGLRRWLLSTRDAHELYRRYGFTELSSPGKVMERFDPDIYTRGAVAPASTERSTT